MSSRLGGLWGTSTPPASAKPPARAARKSLLRMPRGDGAGFGSSAHRNLCAPEPKPPPPPPSPAGSSGIAAAAAAGTMPPPRMTRAGADTESSSKGGSKGGGGGDGGGGGSTHERDSGGLACLASLAWQELQGQPSFEGRYGAWRRLLSWLSLIHI